MTRLCDLYQLVAVETGDEMMGLWSRPIRKGALKHLCTPRCAGRRRFRRRCLGFRRFWNMLLDDYSYGA